jgi:hypothetical protein
MQELQGYLGGMLSLTSIDASYNALVAIADDFCKLATLTDLNIR